MSLAAAPYYSGMDMRRILLAGITTAVVLTLAWLIFIREAAAPWSIVGETMGTSYNVQIADCPADCAGMAAAVDARLTELNQALSHYDPESELSAFNRYKKSDWFPVSADLYNVIAYSTVISRQYGGAFDITLAPVIDLWGFGPNGSEQLPSNKEIITALAQTGYQKVAVQSAPTAVRKSNPAIRADLSGIAKGYAVDQLAQLIQATGSSNYLVEIGGEIRAAGRRSKQHPWRIGIEPPDARPELAFIINPGNQSVASSGDYRNFFITDGKRYSHTIDPRTGKPVEHQLAAVSVILPAAVQADAAATALMVMGPEVGFSYADANGIPALFFVREDRGMIAFYTETFGRYIERGQ